MIVRIRNYKMTRNKKSYLLWILLILSISAYGQKYTIMPSVVIEQKNGITTRFEDDILALENECKCIVEIKDNELSIYYFSSEIRSTREDEIVVPEIFHINFTPSAFEDRSVFSGDNGNSKYVSGYIDITNKDGSLCVYDSNGIYLYIVFEYAIES